MGTLLIDSDQHLYESRSMWADHIDPAHRADALALVDDDRGYTWLTWRDRRIQLADVHLPGDTSSCGRHREGLRRGERSAYDYDDALPDTYWDPNARVGWLDDVGFDAAVCFPNFGLLWERHLSGDLPAMLANMAAWNRWCAAVAADGRGRLHPVAHLSLRDLDWLDAQLAAVAGAGIRLAMIAPALVDGKPLSHPDLDRAWSAFVAHGVTPVFHVADQERPFDDAWYTDQAEDRMGPPVLESIFLYTAAALSLTDLIVNGVLRRHPDLRIGVVELSAVWVPLHLMMLDGGWDFTSRLNGRTVADLDMRPSEYFHRQVRVSSFAYELPARIMKQSGDLYMACSDYPHSEGTATPMADYAAAGRHAVDPATEPGLFEANAAFLLRR